MEKDKRNQNEVIMNILTPKRFSARKVEPQSFIAKRSNAIDELERITDKIDVDKEFKMMIKKTLVKL